MPKTKPYRSHHIDYSPFVRYIENHIGIDDPTVQRAKAKLGTIKSNQVDSNSNSISNSNSNNNNNNNKLRADSFPRLRPPSTRQEAASPSPPPTTTRQQQQQAWNTRLHRNRRVSNLFRWTARAQRILICRKKAELHCFCCCNTSRRRSGRDETRRDDAVIRYISQRKTRR
mmetsp:Transcript_2074/g.4895  ORF Transcript_2074/g.4895 Transcript_2074/m.4895 type:complete len:171 (-) Transcript_2074:309-821(-)